MPLAGWLMLAYMLLVVFSGVVLLIWGWRSGQLRNIEEPKYRMMEDKEPEPWPGRGEKR